ncbi:MAG: hypothetical protein NTAFB05_24280 [Nitrobacter sp.]|uniref:hypothetical protein n=1 Tax=Nitrobacter sp. TaxID=29420 RepID=UPI00387DF6ED
MFRVSAGVLGALAVVMLPGTTHFASSRDLAASENVNAAMVNRAVKADRGVVRASQAEGRTVSVRLERLPDASIVIRIPEGRHMVAGNRAVKPRSRRAPSSSRARRMIACEPVVSLLTDIAKQLQPGRCVT